MATDIKVQLLSFEGSLLAEAVATLPSTAGAASYLPNSIERTLDLTADADPQGTVVLTVNGKEQRLAMKSVKYARQSEIMTRSWPVLEPFKVQTYPKLDATANATYNKFRRGINFGQMWEAIPLLTASASTRARSGAFRNLRVTPELCRLAKAMGYDHVRLPVCHARQAAVDGTLDPGMIAALTVIIPMILDAGLNVVTNQHHSHLMVADSGWWNEVGGSLPDRAAMEARQQAIVVNIVKWLKASGFPADRVMFELENEPHGGPTTSPGGVLNPGWNDTNWNAWWPNALAACRAEDSDRIFLIGGSSYNSTARLANLAAFPDSETKTIMMAHPYEPNPTFTHLHNQPLWSLAFKAQMLTSFALADAAVAARGRPCYMGEFGCSITIPTKHREMYIRDVVNACASRGMGYAVWNMIGGGFDVWQVSGRPDGRVMEAATGVPEPVGGWLQPTTSTGLLYWPAVSWGSGTANSSDEPSPPPTVNGDVVTINRDGSFLVNGVTTNITQVSYYIWTKQRLNPGDWVKFTLERVTSISASAKIKILFIKLGPQIGSWDGTVSRIQPPDYATNPNFPGGGGDHPAGTYYYQVPDIYADTADKDVHDYADPWCIQIGFTSLSKVGDQWRIIAEKVSGPPA